MEHSNAGLIIGVSGPANSGKSTVAEMLADWRFVAVSLADPIKRFARDVWAFSDEQLWGPSDLRNIGDPRYRGPDGTLLTPRKSCQRIGTEGGRECYPNTWVDLCLRIARQLLDDRTGTLRYTYGAGLYAATPAPPLRGVVVPDVRFLNEIEGIQAAGGFVVRIVRPEAGLEGDAGQHASETEQESIPDSKFDLILDNSGTLEQLRENVFAMLEMFASTNH